MTEMRNIFIEEGSYLEDFEKLVDIGRELSHQFKGLNSPTRRLQLSTITLAKIIDNSYSILRLIPSSSFNDNNLDYFDFPSIASLCRDLIEACNLSWYLSFEKISKEEEDLRFDLYDLHDTTELLKIFNFLKFSISEIQYLTNQQEELLNKVKKNPEFLKLNIDNRKKILNNKQAGLYTQFGIAEERKINLDTFNGIYKLLSNQTHTFPSSLKLLTFSRVHDEKDSLLVHITLLVLNYCSMFLADTILNTAKIWNIKFAKMESEQLVEAYSKQLRHEDD